MVGKNQMAENKDKSDELPELVTLKEACDLLKVHPNTLRAWDKKGILLAVRIGEKRIRKYRKDDIRKLMQTG